MGERRSTPSPPKESILGRSSRKWCCGRPRTKIRKIKRLSSEYKRTSSNFWLKCGDTGRKRESIQKSARSERSGSAAEEREHRDGIVPAGLTVPGGVI